MAPKEELATVIVKFVKKMRSKQRGMTLREMTYFVGLGSKLPPKTVARMTRIALRTGVKKGIYIYSRGYYKLPDIDKPHVIKRHIVATPKPKAGPKRPKTRKPRKPRQKTRPPRLPRWPRHPDPIPMGERRRN